MRETFCTLRERRRIAFNKFSQQVSVSLSFAIIWLFESLHDEASNVRQHLVSNGNEVPGTIWSWTGLAICGPTVGAEVLRPGAARKVCFLSFVYGLNVLPSIGFGAAQEVEDPWKHELASGWVADSGNGCKEGHWLGRYNINDDTVLSVDVGLTTSTVQFFPVEASMAKEEEDLLQKVNGTKFNDELAEIVCDHRRSNPWNIETLDKACYLWSQTRCGLCPDQSWSTYMNAWFFWSSVRSMLCCWQLPQLDCCNSAHALEKWKDEGCSFVHSTHLTMVLGHLGTQIPF